jgi:hypothetical protein
VVNPYFIYVLSLVVVILVYLLGWSGLFPELGAPLLLFLTISIVISLLIGRAFISRKIISFNNLENKKSNFYIANGIFLGYILEFAYHKNFPLLSILTNGDLSYHEFGIPSFHVFLVTFNSFFSVYLFHTYLSVNRQKIQLFILFLFTLLPSVLIINRGMLIMILMSCTFVYLIKYQSRITARKILVLGITAFVFFYIFGVAGNIRLNNTYHTNTSLLNNNLFLQIGGATQDFRDSAVPKEFFWSYIYISSPMANLQKNIQDFEHQTDVNLPDTMFFTVTQLLPDFISKRIVGLYEVDKVSVLQITPELNVATAFAEPYIILGWVGISLFTLFIFTFAFFYIVLLKWFNSDYFVVGVAILNTIFVFNTFSNMFAFTGLSFQLFYPLLFTFINFKNLKRMLAANALVPDFKGEKRD